MGIRVILCQETREPGRLYRRLLSCRPCSSSASTSAARSPISPQSTRPRGASSSPRSPRGGSRRRAPYSPASRPSASRARTSGAWSTAPPWAPMRSSSGGARAWPSSPPRAFATSSRSAAPSAISRALRAHLVRPKPVVERKHRFEVSERLNADGSVLVPLDMASVDRALDAALDAGAEAIAVCMLHAYLNPGTSTRWPMRPRASAQVCPCRARPTSWRSTASSSLPRRQCSTRTCSP